MAIADRQSDRGSSNLGIFAISTAVAIAVGPLTYQPIPDVYGTDRDAGAAELADASSRCHEADQASVAQLAPLLARNGPADAAIVERANHTLGIARRHCLYGWQERALEDYAWLRRWLSEQV